MTKISEALYRVGSGAIPPSGVGTLYLALIDTLPRYLLFLGSLPKYLLFLGYCYRYYAQVRGYTNACVSSIPCPDCMKPGGDWVRTCNIDRYAGQCVSN